VNIVVGGLGIGPERVSLEKVLNDFGRFGGPTEYGWHTIEPMFRCWREYDCSKNPTIPLPASRSIALAVGTIFHEFMAAYYSTALVNPVPDLKSPEEIYEALCTNGYTEEANEARRLYEAYRFKYDGNDSYLSPGVRLHAVEHHIRRDLPFGRPYTVRLDLVMERSDGFWICDHKTTGQRSQEFTEGWQVDPSVIGMFWAAGGVFKPLRGVSINGVIKTKTPGFERIMFAVDERMVGDWLQMLECRFTERQSAEKMKWPPNLAACFRKMGAHVGKCRYFERCVYGVTE
jgi:hypothetical protein